MGVKLDDFNFFFEKTARVKQMLPNRHVQVGIPQYHRYSNAVHLTNA